MTQEDLKLSLAKQDENSDLPSVKPDFIRQLVVNPPVGYEKYFTVLLSKSVDIEEFAKANPDSWWVDLECLAFIHRETGKILADLSWIMGKGFYEDSADFLVDLYAVLGANGVDYQPLE